MSGIERYNEPSTYRFEQIVPCWEVEVERPLRRARFADDIFNPHVRSVARQQPLGRFDNLLPPDLWLQASTGRSSHGIALLTYGHNILTDSQYQATFSVLPRLDVKSEGCSSYVRKAISSGLRGVEAH